MNRPIKVTLIFYWKKANFLHNNVQKLILNGERNNTMVTCINYFIHNASVSKNTYINVKIFILPIKQKRRLFLKHITTILYIKYCSSVIYKITALWYINSISSLQRVTNLSIKSIFRIFLAVNNVSTIINNWIIC